MNNESFDNKLIRLSANFKQDSVSWFGIALRKQGNGHVAVAAPYVNARDIMERLDDVLGAANWKDEYTVHEDRTTCTLYVKINGEWVGKNDGANDTDIEGAKGAYSSAFKRAAVKWGIGRQLYALGSVWCPCDTKKDRHGKDVFKSFTDDPWKYVKEIPEVSEESKRANANGSLYKIEEIYPDILEAFLKERGIISE